MFHLQVKTSRGSEGATGSPHLPRSFGGSSPAPRPPFPTEPSLSRSHRAASRSAPLERDKTSPKTQKSSVKEGWFENSDLGCVKVKRLFHF